MVFVHLLFVGLYARVYFNGQADMLFDKETAFLAGDSVVEPNAGGRDFGCNVCGDDVYSRLVRQLQPVSHKM